MESQVDWAEVNNLLEQLYDASARLEEIFAGRRFTLDGHLVGSVGEVIAAYMFDLDLRPGSTLAHDALTKDGRPVEIKFTQGKSVAIRHEPGHLIVLCRARGARTSVVFNGPGLAAWEAAGAMQKNGQRPIRLSRLAALNKEVPDTARLPMFRAAPV